MSHGGARTLPLDLRWLLLALVFVAIFAGCQGGRYYFANRLQELGIASALLLFALRLLRLHGLIEAHDRLPHELGERHRLA